MRADRAAPAPSPAVVTTCEFVSTSPSFETTNPEPCEAPAASSCSSPKKAKIVTTPGERAS